MRSLSLSIALVALFAAQAAAQEAVRLGADPALSPTGETLAFSWRGDVWTVPVAGGEARQLTRHPARDSQPHFSPDGTELAFVSNRTGSSQVFVMPVDGGRPEQITHHTAGHALYGWYPDGAALLVQRQGDSFWRRGSRFWKIDRRERRAPEMIFDAYGNEAHLSPDGSRLIFTREGTRWWRKGYVGSQASQIWTFEDGSFRKLLSHERGMRHPLWREDGHGLYFVSAETGSFNLHSIDLKNEKRRQLTKFSDDSVLFPCISKDGSTIVFRHLFDFYSLRPGRDEAPKRIGITVSGDWETPRTDRRLLKEATDLSFSKDGLEAVFISGGDLWVMDTVLREPRRITNTPGPESGPAMAPDGSAILFVSDRDGQTDIWRAERADGEKYWWQNESFNLTQLTSDAEVEGRLSFSPDGSKVAYIRGRGDLQVMNPDGKGGRRVLGSWNAPQYDWSPDGRWFVYALSDNNYNRDIWIAPLDGSREPVNISRHPDSESNPRWSPDGKVIAFTGRRIDDEVDIFYIWLRQEDDEKQKRHRTLEEALEKMKKNRKAPPAAEGKEQEKPEAPPEEKQEKQEEEKPPELVIDFDGIHERIHRISIPDASESGLFWSHDSKKLAFGAKIGETEATWTVEFPDEFKPKTLVKKRLSSARWLKKGGIVALADKTPVQVDKGKVEAWKFAAQVEVDLVAHRRAGFDIAWRIMRDRFYDERLGNRNWAAIRRKYREAAAYAVDGRAFSETINMMLGELNGSHLGFRSTEKRWEPDGDWKVETAWLGARWDRTHQGPGLKVRDVVPESPADRLESRLEPGDVVLQIDGRPVDPAIDLTEVLNGRLDRELRLSVRNAAGEEREVRIRPMAWSRVSRLLYAHWVKQNQAAVEKLSGSTLGYMHIRGMNWSSFLKFEAELYSIGAGKEGIVIDVRDNGGGSTTDHLLTILTQPKHAITVPRGGGQGYPQGRRVYATWDRPIVVLCNQNSFSNAEIFSHAIRTLKRGQVVGVPTAGGVISTGRATVMDLGTIRTPGRGWYVVGSGEDMELNGVMPHHVVWPEPGELPAGTDRQLEVGVQVLLKSVETWKARPQPKLRKASER